MDVLLAYSESVGIIFRHVEGLCTGFDDVTERKKGNGERKRIFNTNSYLVNHPLEMYAFLVQKKPNSGGVFMLFEIVVWAVG